MNTQTNTHEQTSKNQILDLMIRFILVVALLYFFLVGVKLLGGSFKMMGNGFAQSLLDVTHNPILALFSGMLATVLFQSSSVTTSIIVGLVASGTLPLGGAIPMVMGANLGTSVTNSLVSLGYIKNKQHFKKAFAAATIHDFFNILTVAIMLPLELATGFLEKCATALATVLYGTASGVKYSSPIKATIKPVAKGVQSFITETLGLQANFAAIAMLVVSFAFIIIALTLIVKIMKVVVESNKGEIVENLLSKNGYFSIFFGMMLTIAVQSSSITTSLLVPMAGAGVLTLRSILPVTIGANIGTTATALLAALTGNVTGLAIALVHFLFNIAGFLIWFIHPKMREIPLKLCEKLADLTLRNRFNGLAYIGLIFFIVPLLLIVIL